MENQCKVKSYETWSDFGYSTTSSNTQSQTGDESAKHRNGLSGSNGFVRRLKKSYSSDGSASCSTSESSGYVGEEQKSSTSPNNKQSPKQYDEGSSIEMVISSESSRDKKFLANDEKTLDVDINIDIQKEIQVATTSKEIEVALTRFQNSKSKEKCCICVNTVKNRTVLCTSFSFPTYLGYPDHMSNEKPFMYFVDNDDKCVISLEITRYINKINDEQTFIVSDPMLCRLKCYKSLSSSFEIQNQTNPLALFSLTLILKSVIEDSQVIYLIIHGEPIISPYKVIREVFSKEFSFTIGYSPDGYIHLIDNETVKFIGFLPREIVNKHILDMCHIDDIQYLSEVFKRLLTKKPVESNRYRLKTRDEDFIEIETEWEVVTDPSTNKIEYIAGKNFLLQGPAKCDVFSVPKLSNAKDVDEKKIEAESTNKLRNSDAKQNLVNCKRELCDTYQTAMNSSTSCLNASKDNPLLRGIGYDMFSLVLKMMPNHYKSLCNSYPEAVSSNQQFYKKANYRDLMNRYFRSQPPCHEVYDVLPTPKLKQSSKSSDSSTISSNCSSMSESSSNSSSANIEFQDSYESKRLSAKLLEEFDLEVKQRFLLSLFSKPNVSQDTKKNSEQCNADFNIKDRGVKRTLSETSSDHNPYKHFCASQCSQNQPEYNSFTSPVQSNDITTPYSTSTLEAEAGIKGVVPEIYSSYKNENNYSTPQIQPVVKEEFPINNLKQSILLQKQYNQLRSEELKGLVTNLTLQENDSSSSSTSYEEPSKFHLKLFQSSRKKCNKEKIAIIYEENAPMFSQSEENENSSS